MSSKDADLILVNGRIATQDERRSIVQALAIKDGQLHRWSATKPGGLGPLGGEAFGGERLRRRVYDMRPGGSFLPDLGE